MGQIQEDRSVWYFSQSQGWIHEREPADPKYRLTAVGRTHHHVVISNRLEQLGPDGQWSIVPPEVESMLPAVERGLSFVLRPIQTERGSFMQIDSKRFMDQEMLTSLYEGIALFDVYGEPLTDSELAFDRVCVERTQADTFANRVKTRGGQILEATADVYAMYEALARLQTVYQELERVCSLSLASAEGSAEELQAEAARLSERSQTVHHLRSQAVERVDFIRSEKMTLDQQSSSGDQELGAPYLQNAEMWLSHIEKLYRDHRNYEQQAVVRLQEAVLRTLPDIDGRALERRYLFVPVVEYYTAELNQECQLSDDGMVVAVDGATVEFGETARVTSQDGVRSSGGPPRIVERDQRSI